MGRSALRSASSQSLAVQAKACASSNGSADHAQPFQLQIAAAALVELDFHAHCSSQAALGLLGGFWDGADHILQCGPAPGLAAPDTGPACSTGLSADQPACGLACSWLCSQCPSQLCASLLQGAQGGARAGPQARGLCGLGHLAGHAPPGQHPAHHVR